MGLKQAWYWVSSLITNDSLHTELCFHTLYSIWTGLTTFRYACALIHDFQTLALGMLLFPSMFVHRLKVLSYFRTYSLPTTSRQQSIIWPCKLSPHRKLRIRSIGPKSQPPTPIGRLGCTRPTKWLISVRYIVQNLLCNQGTESAGRMPDPVGRTYDCGV